MPEDREPLDLNTWTVDVPVPLTVLGGPRVQIGASCRRHDHVKLLSGLAEQAGEPIAPSEPGGVIVDHGDQRYVVALREGRQPSRNGMVGRLRTEDRR